MARANIAPAWMAAIFMPGGPGGIDVRGAVNGVSGRGAGVKLYASANTPKPSPTTTIENTPRMPCGYTRGPDVRNGPRPHRVGLTPRSAAMHRRSPGQFAICGTWKQGLWRQLPGWGERAHRSERAR